MFPPTTVKQQQHTADLLLVKNVNTNVSGGEKNKKKNKKKNWKAEKMFKKAKRRRCRRRRFLASSQLRYKSPATSRSTIHSPKSLAAKYIYPYPVHRKLKHPRKYVQIRVDRQPAGRPLHGSSSRECLEKKIVKIFTNYERHMKNTEESLRAKEFAFSDKLMSL